MKSITKEVPAKDLRIGDIIKTEDVDYFTITKILRSFTDPRRVNVYSDRGGYTAYTWWEWELIHRYNIRGIKS